MFADVGEAARGFAVQRRGGAPSKLRCAVCGRESAIRQETVSGDFFGNACEGACLGLLWEAWFIKRTAGSEFDHALILWQWKRRRAEVEGRPFAEAPPKSIAEKAWGRVALSRDVPPEVTEEAALLIAEADGLKRMAP